MEVTVLEQNKEKEKNIEKKFEEVAGFIKFFYWFI